MKELISTPELCEECSRCERTCPQNAIRVINGVPIFCLHCSPERAPCLTVCPEDAIGGFGGKQHAKYEPALVFAALKLGCPVRLVLTLEETFQAVRRTSCETYIRTGFTHYSEFEGVHKGYSLPIYYAFRTKSRQIMKKLS